MSKRKKRYSFSKCKELCKEYKYDFTQEGESIIIGTNRCVLTFPTKQLFTNWFYYHHNIELSGDYDDNDTTTT